MSIITGAIFFLIILLVLIITSTPIVVVFGLSSAIFLYLTGLDAFKIIPHRMFNSLQTISFTAIPYFLLMGELLHRGRFAKKLVDFADSVVGHFTGGLSLTNVFVSMLFGGISGSAVADSSAIGATLIPIMKNSNYSPEFSSAVTAASSGIGIIVPPSIPMIILAGLIGISVSKLFIAGIIPGILIGIFEMILAFYISRKNGFGNKNRKFSFKRVFSSFLAAFPLLLVIIIVLGGSLSGMYTVTEAASIGAIYTMFLVIVIYKEIPIKQIPEILLKVAVNTSIVLIIVATSSTVSWVLTILGIPTLIQTFLSTVTSSKLIVLLLISLFYVIAGMMIEGTAILVMLTPVFLPVVKMFDIDIIHFAVISVITLAIGGVTPPMGIYAYITTNIAGVKLEKTFISLIPFLGILIFVLLIVIIFPNQVFFLVK